MSKTEELAFRVAGPEDRVAAGAGAGAEVVEAAWRLAAGIVIEGGLFGEGVEIEGVGFWKI